MVSSLSCWQSAPQIHILVWPCVRFINLFNNNNTLIMLWLSGIFCLSAGSEISVWINWFKFEIVGVWNRRWSLLRPIFHSCACQQQSWSCRSNAQHVWEHETRRNATAPMPTATTTTVADDATSNETRDGPCATTVHAANVQYATDASANATKHEYADDG